jgi:DNA-binding NarL/FixJ family response regulator
VSGLASTWNAVQRVSICDERPTARTALTRVVSGAIPSVTDVDSSADGPELVAQYAANAAGLVLIGIRSGKARGLEAAFQLLDSFPTAAVIVYGSVDDTRPLTAAIERGARGFLLWDANNPVSSPARQVVSSFGRLSPGGDGIKVAARLTERELQILRGMTHGLSNNEIGRKLFLSEDTVKTHARRLFRKLGARDRAQAVALGFRRGFVA